MSNFALNYQIRKQIYFQAMVLPVLGPAPKRARWCLVYPLKIFRREDWTAYSEAHLTESFESIATRVPDPNQETIMLAEEPSAKEIRLDMKEELARAGAIGDRLGEYFMRQQVNQAVFSFDRPNVMTRDAAERIDSLDTSPSCVA
jgi:hypothetical protein